MQPHVWNYDCCAPMQVFGLGFVSVFDQVLEGLKDDDRTALFNAYIAALGEDGNQYRKVMHHALHSAEMLPLKSK